MNIEDDFKLEMSEYVPVEVSKKKVYSSKNVKVKYRCEHTEAWVDMLINEDDLKVILNPVKSIGKSWLKEILPDDCIIYNKGLIDGVDVKIISWDEGVDITNNLNYSTKDKPLKPKEKQIENNAWNGGKNKRFSGYNSYY